MATSEIGEFDQGQQTSRISAVKWADGILHQA